jgi:hypothetical protein
MLVLAGLTYRGGVSHGDFVVGAVERGLDEHARGWTRVWGPVSSHVVGDPIDACAMYVARATSPTRYVVAVRGTNPLSMSDWVFGDFNVATTVAWPFDPAGAEMSTSTAFGLRWLLKLRESTPQVWNQLVARVAENLRLPDEMLDATRGIAAARARLRSFFVGPLVARFGGLFRNVPVNAGVTAFAGRLIAGADRVQPGALALGTAQGAGGLLDFLAKASTAEADPLDVVVTGHSKGGALAPVLALWLHERRADWVTAGKQAQIRCCAFAGPTPGNGTLARRIEDALGDGLSRVVNTNDIVTHAWALADLDTIPDLYDTRSRELRGLIGDVEQDLRQQRLDYRQPGPATVRFPGRLAPLQRSFADEFVYQHMDAYLAQAGLTPRIDAVELFAG